jgi:hypothetical protein
MTETTLYFSKRRRKPHKQSTRQKISRALLGKKRKKRTAPVLRVAGLGLGLGLASLGTYKLLNKKKKGVKTFDTKTTTPIPSTKTTLPAKVETIQDLENSADPFTLGSNKWSPEVKKPNWTPKNQIQRDAMAGKYDSVTGIGALYLPGKGQSTTTKRTRRLKSNKGKYRNVPLDYKTVGFKIQKKVNPFFTDRYRQANFPDAPLNLPPSKKPINLQPHPGKRRKNKS